MPCFCCRDCAIALSLRRKMSENGKRWQSHKKCHADAALADDGFLRPFREQGDDARLLLARQFVGTAHFLPFPLTDEPISPSSSYTAGSRGGTSGAAGGEAGAPDGHRTTGSFPRSCGLKRAGHFGLRSAIDHTEARNAQRDRPHHRRPVPKRRELRSKMRKVEEAGPPGGQGGPPPALDQVEVGE
jgi:hypothetical protein